jgi:fatty-acyl-CoA synthase
VVLVPLSTRATAHELAGIAADAALSALVYDGELAEVAGELRERSAAAAAGRAARPTVWATLDPPGAAGELSWQEVVAAHAGEPNGAAGGGRAPALRRPHPDDLYCLLYTSGTTGEPKGVMIPHRMVAWNAFNTACCWRLRADDVSPVFTPLYHAGALMAFLGPIFAVGGTVVLHRGFDPAEVWRTIEAEGCTVVLGVPTIWKLLAGSPDFATVDLSRVRWLISGGAPLPRYLIETYQRRGVAFKQGFGMTEAGVNCFAMSVEEAAAKAGSIGRPMMYAEVRLVDGEGRDVPVGEVGEMLFRGPHLALGYWRRPEETAAAFDRDGWLHTGDLARRDEDGFFYVAGRRKDLLISGGVNVYPAEIEAALLLHPAVEDAAVVGVPDATWGEIGVAFVVLRPGAAPDPAAALHAHLGERLARYKLPKSYRVVPELPRTAYGKVVKAELRRRLVDESGGGGAAGGDGETG